MDSVGGMDTTQMFSSLVNRDAEVLVLKDCRTNEFPNVLESDQSYDTSGCPAEAHTQI